MATMITTSSSSSSSYHLTCHGKLYKSQRSFSRSYNILYGKKSTTKIDKTTKFLRFDATYGISISVSTQDNFKAKASSSPNSSPSSWQKWLLGILLTVILPAIGYKRGIFQNLKGKIDKAVETAEHVTEIVEEIAEEAEKIVEEVEEKLPEDSKFKQRLESFDDLAKEAVSEAKKAEGVIRKVKDVEEEIEETIDKAQGKNK